MLDFAGERVSRGFFDDNNFQARFVIGIQNLVSFYSSNPLVLFTGNGFGEFYLIPEEIKISKGYLSNGFLLHVNAHGILFGVYILMQVINGFTRVKTSESLLSIIAFIIMFSDNYSYHSISFLFLFILSLNLKLNINSKNSQ